MIDTPPVLDGGFVQYAPEVERCRVLSGAEQRAAVVRWRTGDTSALRALIESNLHLTPTLSQRYQHHELPLLDLIEEGNLGLIKAARTYQSDTLTSFRSYATRWISEHMERAVMADTRAAPKMPQALMMARIGVEAAFAQALPESPKAGTKPMRRFSKFERALSHSVEQGEPFGLPLRHPESLPGSLPDQADPVESIWKRQLRTLVGRWFNHLSPLQAEILKGRYGLLNAREEPYQDLSQRLGCPVRCVRRIEMQALESVRVICAEQGIHRCQ